MYASNCVEERKILWEDMRTHQDSNMFCDKEWLIMDDFNEILDGEEHSDFHIDPSIPPGKRDFQRVAQHCSLLDLGYHGPLFTWCKKRNEGLICKKLDRVLFNDVALRRFTQAYSVFESGGCSDHTRCRIQLLQQLDKVVRAFKFVGAMGKLPGFLPILKDYWDSTDKLFHSTSAMFRFSKKLKALKPLLRNLGRESLGNLTKRAAEARSLLCEKNKKLLMIRRRREC